MSNVQAGRQRLKAIGACLSGLVLAFGSIDAFANQGQAAAPVAPQQSPSEPTQALDPAEQLRQRVQDAATRRAWSEVDALAAEAEAAANASRASSGKLWLQLGKARYAQARFKEAEAILDRAVQAFGPGDSAGGFEALQLVGVARAQQGRLPDALESMMAAEAMGRRLGIAEDPTFLSRAAGLHIYLADWPKAVAYAERALAAAEANPAAVPNPTGIYNNLGTAWNGQQEYEKAFHWFQKSYEYSKAHGLPAMNALNNLATVLREWGRHREALEKFEEVERLASAENNRELMAVAAKNIGETLIRLDQRARAATYLDRAYAIYVETDQRPKRLELYPVMIENLEALGRTADALHLLREYKTLSDEVVNVESRERIAKLETAIELARKDSELAASERERLQREADLATLKARQERERLVGYGLLALLALLAGFIVLLVRDRRFKARAHKDLTLKSEQIERQRQDLEALNAAVRRQSQEDELTGLKNRRYLAQLMDERHHRRASDARQPGALAPALFILIDLDNFKEINDRHGHATGDRVLVEFAGILRECQRESDVLVRWGGEEFVWLCPDTPASAAPALCARVRSQLHARGIVLDGGVIPLTASMGYAPHPLWADVAPDWALSLRVADAALYHAKSEGRDRWVGFVAGATPSAEVHAAGDVATLVAGGNLERVRGQGAP